LNSGLDQTLFSERREDLAVRFLQDRPPEVVHTYWSGKAARGRCLTYRSDSAAVRGGGEPGGGYPELSSSLFEPLYADFRQALAGRRADLVLSARGVAFDQRIVVARAGSEPVEERRSGARLRLECRFGGALAVTEMVRPFDRPVEAGSLLDHLERRLEAVDAPEGEMPVLFAPGVAGVLVHEIVGHALEADTIIAGRSWLAELEEQIAPKGLSIVDDPRRGRAAWRTDDEGTPARAVPLVRDGLVGGWLHDRKSAALSGRSPTGHGRCSSFREDVLPRMGCTFIAAGPFSPDEILQGMTHGLYVRRMEAANTDTALGRALFRVTDSDLIRNGKIDVPLKPHLLAIDGAAALSSMDRVADDLRFDTCIGSCHRDGQPIATSVGAPTIRIGVAGVK
jgi:predicted Zn-dependent protease